MTPNGIDLSLKTLLTVLFCHRILSLRCLLLAGCLLDAWQNSSSHGQRRDVISWVSKRVLEITEDDAQALDDKDPEHPGFYDNICNRLTCCNGR